MMRRFGELPEHVRAQATREVDEIAGELEAALGDHPENAILFLEQKGWYEGATGVLVGVRSIAGAGEDVDVRTVMDMLHIADPKLGPRERTAILMVLDGLGLLNLIPHDDDHPAFRLSAVGARLAQALRVHPHQAQASYGARLPKGGGH